MTPASIGRLTASALLVALLAPGAAAQSTPRGVSLPGLYGLRVAPAYDRVNGLSLPWGPRWQFSEQGGQMNATLTYRSNRGIVDPAGDFEYSFANRLSVVVRGGRETRTNDAWIRPGVANAVGTLLAGEDTRNHFSATYAEGALAWPLTTNSAEITPQISLGWEDARSIQLGRSAFSFFARHDSLNGMRRPNPAIAPGRIVSARALVTAQRSIDDVLLNASAAIELPIQSALGTDWTQTTLDAAVMFPTFGAQHLDMHTHVVVSSGNATPPQRYVYLGGAGTFATANLLAGGGDRMVFLESDYVVPLPWPAALMIFGPPTVSARHIVGSVGVGDLPSFVQNVGVRVTWGYLGIEWLLDPDTHKSSGQAVFLSGMR